MAAIIGNNELISTREFDYPRERVFEAWTDPDQLARWWGPNGFSNTFHEFDLRPGGTWRLTMHGPDGTDYANHNRFEEIVPSERIVIRHLPGHEFQLTAIFEELDNGRTRMTFRQLFMDAADFEQSKKMCAEANEQNLDRLNAVLVNEG
ncbi:SRPBCC family protein [Paenibacillus sp. J22TS3]|uniref:SRPBCC family protein n=1 Tax=Paenibacillus sp. J22TS3 TaxID=2807192 RepID=UPI001B2CCBD6|nr:SRPBCC family protein [Paenibacillus sp. J22TS3]GIP22160.1 activator of HSP90 ATPase [Paenibacillus sp. J22TS3]